MSAKPSSSMLGITRNVTEIFALLRSNAEQNKATYSNSLLPEETDERMSLVALEDGLEHVAVEQPLWIHTFDEVEFEFERIKARLHELEDLQKKHLSRPNIGDEAIRKEEQLMESTTEQITSMLSHCQRLIGLLKTQGSINETRTEAKLRNNVMIALLTTLGQLTEHFRNHQTGYLKMIKNRSSNVQDYLVTTAESDEPSWEQLVDVTPSKEYSMVQLQEIMSNEMEVRQREKEVLAVNSSIRELSSLFKDVSQMIVDQGTILDRIDFNIEQTTIRVSKATSSVEQAERHQRNDKKMYCICILSVAIIFVLLLITLKKRTD